MALFFLWNKRQGRIFLYFFFHFFLGNKRLGGVGARVGAGAGAGVGAGRGGGRGRAGVGAGAGAEFFGTFFFCIFLWNKRKGRFFCIFISAAFAALASAGTSRSRG